MDITYSYKVLSLDYTNNDNKGVISVHYCIQAKKDDCTVGFHGSMNFVPKPDDPNYTPFEELTEETVLGWVKGELDTTQIEQALAQKLDKKLNPTIVSGLPWPEDTEEIPE